MIALFLLFVFSSGISRVSSTGDESGYSAAIITNPRQGPFRHGQAVEFSCVVEPAPPCTITYQWRTVEYSYGGNTYTQQNFSTSYRYRNLRYCWYFCEVSLNQTVIGSASRLVEVQGFVYSTGPVVRSFSRGGRLQLNVDISTHYLARYITSLAWYHNGTQIISGTKFTVSDDNMELTVSNMEEHDAGVYEVKINSTDLTSREDPNDPQCDALFIPLLELVAAYAPVTFTVQENTLPTYDPLSIVNTHYITENNGSDYTIELRSASQINLSLLERSQRSDYWFRNGCRIADGGMYVSAISNHETNLSVTHSDVVGSYVGILQWYSWRHDFEVCRSYADYIDDLDITRFPVAVSYWNVILYRPPLSVQLHLHRSVLTAGESTMIECTADGGGPKNAISLTLWRNDQLLTSTNGDYLSYYTQPNSYGDYKCAVGDIHNTSILSERAHLQLLLEDINYIQCGELRNQHSEVIQAAFSDVIISMRPDIYAGNIENIQLNCIRSREFAYLTADLLYSDPEGRITASTLLEMFLTWIQSQENPSLVVNGLQVSLSKQCPTQLNDVTSDACINYYVSSADVAKSSGSAGSTSLTAGVFFGGLTAGIVIAVIAVGLICCVRRCLKAQSDKAMEIPMATNQAYESVDVHHKTEEKGRSQDEAIYEIPEVR